MQSKGEGRYLKARGMKGRTKSRCGLGTIGLLFGLCITAALTLGLTGCSQPVVGDEGEATWTPTAEQGWRQVEETDLRVVEGSVLDFSQVLRYPVGEAMPPIRANDQGHLVAPNGERSRFLCAPFNFAGPHGGFPDHDESDQFALQLRRSGYNLVRFHFVDNVLMARAEENFGYDEETFDRFHYLLAALKEQGIYWMIDAATSWYGAYAAPPGESRRDLGVNHLHLEVQFKPEAQEHWKQMVLTILGKKNPYTGQSTLTDPALLAITTVNEGGVLFNVDRKAFENTQAEFDSWVNANFNPRSAAKKMRAYTEIERTTYNWMAEFLKDQGFNGYVTAYNNGKRVQSRAAGQFLQLNSIHAYFDHPKNFVREGNSQEGDSSITELAWYVRYFATSRYGGKPFIVDEYDHPFWNSWRREAGMVVPAYAAFQDWDAICRFVNPVALKYDLDGVGRKSAIYPFGIGMDPVTRAGETLSALLFRRGDVSPAMHRVALDITPNYMYANGGGNLLFPEYASRLALRFGVGLRWRERGVSFEDAAWQPDKEVRVKLPWRARRMPSFDYLLPKDNQTDLQRGIYQTDTNEITLDRDARRATVVTRQTEAVTLDGGLPVELPHLTVHETSGPALISVSALDEQPIESSQRLLLTFVTDALNSDMVFDSADRRSVLELGGLPVLIKTGTAKLSLRHAEPARLRLYAVGLNGQRHESLPVLAGTRDITFSLDTAALEFGPTTYFELAVTQ